MTYIPPPPEILKNTEKHKDESNKHLYFYYRASSIVNVLAYLFLVFLALVRIVQLTYQKKFKNKA